MSDILDAIHRVGERKLSSLRNTRAYRASLSIAAGACGGPFVDDSLPPPTSRYDTKIEPRDLLVFSIGLGKPK